MAVVSLVGSKVILALCNFLLLACGFILTLGGMLLLFDSERVLLTKLLSTGQLPNLPQPLLYYIAIGLSLLGLLIAGTGILGCWASCLNNYCLLTFYFLIIMVALIGECAVYGIAWAWPNCVGLGLDVMELTKALQRNYGTGGQEQFTAAVDLAQNMFNCCGVASANEYDTSLWRLQSLGPSLAVPLTCCKLENANQSLAYLNPVPVDSSLCQALERSRHEGYRHINGCKDPLEQWYREHYIVFLEVGLALVLIEFMVLLSTILMCTRIYHHKQGLKQIVKNQQIELEPASSMKESSYKRPPSAQTGAYSNETYAMTGSFRQNYNLVDRA